jgi:glycosyltransferase involved in cell wall biosynthesis
MVNASIIVPCYKQAAFLNECLESVLSQSYLHWECIIINDGSPDNTEQLALEWVKKDSRFRYIYQENAGLSAARNAGIRAAHGEYILPLDADDKISQDFLEACICEFHSQESVKLVYGNCIKFGTESGPAFENSYSYDSLLLENMIVCTSMYRKKDAIEAGLYDTNLIYGAEDWDFWIRLLDRNSLVIKNTNIVFYYRVKEQSMIKELKSNIERVNWTVDYILSKNKNRYDYQNVLELYTEINNQSHYIDYLHRDFKLLHKKLTYFQIVIILVKKMINWSPR